MQKIEELVKELGFLCYNMVVDGRFDFPEMKAKADLVCETAKRDGGIQAYLNVMDESNNDADIIDNEMCVLSTSIEPGRGAGKMIHELTIYRTGGMSALIKEE